MFHTLTRHDWDLAPTGGNGLWGLPGGRGGTPVVERLLVWPSGASRRARGHVWSRAVPTPTPTPAHAAPAPDVPTPGAPAASGPTMAHARRLIRAQYALIYVLVGGFGNFFGIWLREIGWDETQIGWQGGAFAACLVLFPLLWGRRVDRTGDAARSLRTITLGAALAFTPFLLTHHFTALLAATLLFGAFRTGVVTAADTYTLHLVAKHGAHKVGDYGSHRVWGSAGFIVGALGLGWIIGATSRHAVPVFMASVLTVHALSARLVPADPTPPGAPERLAVTLRRLLALPHLRRFYGVTFLSRLASQGIYVFLPLHLQDLGVPDERIAWYWTVGVLSEITLIRLSPRLFRHLRPVQVIALTIFLTGVEYALIAVIPNPWALLPVMLLHGMSFGVWYVYSVVWLGGAVPEADRGRAQGVFQSLGFGVGGTLSAVLSGYLYYGSGGPALFAAAAALSLATAALALRTLRTLRD